MWHSIPRIDEARRVALESQESLRNRLTLSPQKSRERGEGRR